MATTISIAMCTYNGARYLKDQLDSIAAQTRPPDELVICDDCSSDESLKIINAFAAKASFAVRIYVNERNFGSTRNFERALSLCEGNIIALSDQDDVWFPEKLARLETEFTRAPGIGLSFSDAEVVDESLCPTGQTLWQTIGVTERERQKLQTRDAIHSLLQGSIVTGATMAFRSSFKELILPIPGDLKVIHDGWIAMVISAVSEILPISDPLMKYRQHTGQQVGPLTRQRPARSNSAAAAKTALRRENVYADLIAIAQTLRDRLSENSLEFDSREAVASLDARITHLRARSTLPDPRLKRVGTLLRELLSWRYHRYSKGLSSAAKDLVKRSQPRRGNNREYGNR